MKIIKTRWTKGAGIGILLVVATGLVYLLMVNKETLPIYNPVDFNPDLVESGLQKMQTGHKVSDFSLINQDGDTITQKDYAGKIYVVDFFFTRCPSICPIMTTNMGKLQQEFIKEDDVKFLSMSVTPELDSVSILKKYADKNGALVNKWNITTGDKTHIYNLARKSYFAAVDEGDGGLQDFIHTPNFVLVDKDRRIRGVYDGTNDLDVERAAQDIKRLQHQF